MVLKVEDKNISSNFDYIVEFTAKSIMQGNILSIRKFYIKQLTLNLLLLSLLSVGIYFILK
jgi:hypothetical protein